MAVTINNHVDFGTGNPVNYCSCFNEHSSAVSFIKSFRKKMTVRQTAISCIVLRGGTSRGVYFRRADLPDDESARDRILLEVMGGPDDMQVDGIGGRHPLTNKVAIVGPSERDDADVDYLFLQVIPEESRTADMQNCGNILAGVGPFAIESGLVAAGSPVTRIRVHMVNSGSLCELAVETPEGVVNYDGDTKIDGVPGSAAPIICDFLDIAGSACGQLLPTGNVIDTIDGVDATCIDNGMPVVVLRAADLALSGYELPEELEANDELKARLESLRRKLGPLMNLGNVADLTVPKMCLVAEPRNGGTICTRTFIPHVCHRSIGVLGAVTVATACLLPESVANAIAEIPDGDEKTLAIEHPTGSLSIRLAIGQSDDGNMCFEKAGVIRSARMLMRGDVFVRSI
jgi:4-oxalomesaconate tautomerase